MWRAVITRCALKRGPVRVDHCRTITDVGRCAWVTMQEVVTAVAAKNADEKHWLRDLVHEMLAVLKACGVVAKLEEDAPETAAQEAA